MDGDAAAMDALYGRYRVEVHSWLVYMTGDAAEAEDLYQDAWLKIIESAERFKGGNFRAWLWRIVRNLAIDHARKKRPLLVLDAEDADDGGHPADALPGDDGSGVFAALETAELRAAAKRAVASLAAHEREVVLLRTQSALGFKEIADVLGIPLNTALARMHRATAKLKAALAAAETLRKIA